MIEYIYTRMIEKIHSTDSFFLLPFFTADFLRFLCKRLLGRRYQDNFVQQEKDLNVYSIVEKHLNDRKYFSLEQITGVMFTKLKQLQVQN